MKPIEIERKFLTSKIPYTQNELEGFNSLKIEQGYLSTGPVVRVRRQNDNYFLTYKGKGRMAREEYNLPLTPDSYLHLLKKCDGNIIYKTRYIIPISHPVSGNPLNIELDIFEGKHRPIIIAEVEFSSLEEAGSFSPPSWLVKDVTESSLYHNSVLALDFIPERYKADFPGII